MSRTNCIYPRSHLRWRCRDLTGARTSEGDARPSIPSTQRREDPEKTTAFLGRSCCGSRGTNAKHQLAVMFGVYLFTVGSFNHVQMSSGVQVQGHPVEQFPLGFCDVTFAHSS